MAASAAAPTRAAATAVAAVRRRIGPDTKVSLQEAHTKPVTGGATAGPAGALYWCKAGRPHTHTMASAPPAYVGNAEGYYEFSSFL